jgi:murein DD-endopeptidase MepM/ murein hydrolase activator NlpD
MMILYGLQIFLPLLFIAWVALSPLNNTAGFWVQAVATAFGIFAILYSGLWLFPPWWAPHIFAGLLLASVVASLVWREKESVWPSKLLQRFFAAGFAVLGLFAANKLRLAITATQIPGSSPLNLSSPLGAGTYLIANGGSGIAMNAHADALDQSIPAHKPYWGTSYAIDFVAINGWGFRASGVMPADPKQYFVFGIPVIAPCGGEVIQAVDGLPDMQIPIQDAAHLAGNHIILRCGNYDILLAHFKSGSVLVYKGAHLVVGSPVAEVGNSGESGEPHLHIHAQAHGTADAPFSGAPIPILINGRYLVRNDRVVVHASGEQLKPTNGQLKP